MATTGLKSNLERAFGFNLERGSIAKLTQEETREFEQFKADIRNKTNELALETSKLRVYVQLLIIHPQERYRELDSLEKRLNQLRLHLKVTGKSKGEIKFLNDTLSLQAPELPSEVTLSSSENKRAYEIPGSYLATNPRLCDFIVTQVEDTIHPRDRRIQLFVKGEPTAAYSSKAGEYAKHPSKFDILLAPDLRVDLV